MKQTDTKELICVLLHLYIWQKYFKSKIFVSTVIFLKN